MVARGAPDLDSLQVWDSEGLWESTARGINIGKHQRQAPPPSTAHHRADVHLRRHPPPIDAFDHAKDNSHSMTGLRMIINELNVSANRTINSNLSHTEVRTTASTTTAPRTSTPKAAAPSKAAPHMSYPIGVAGERATQLANTDRHAPMTAAELCFNTKENALFLELLRKRAAMYEAEMVEMQARVDFQGELQRRRARADACARLHQPPPQQRYHHRPVDRRYSYQSYSQAPRNTYQSHGHASFDPYTYGYGGVEYNCDGGEFVEACSGDIIVNNHYYNTCGCHESEYDSDPVGGEDADSEYGRMYPESEDPEYDAWYDEIGIHEGDPDYHDYHAESDGAEDEPERD